MVEKIQGYCVKCRAKRDMVAPKEVTKGKRKFMMGTCPVCKTKMARILGKAK
jgi:Zn finger protein HypA/HybF involved in hydrogenase expression